MKLLTALMLPLLVIALAPVDAAADPPLRDEYRITTLFPGGDVLRPGPKSEDGHFYLGFDLGLTYSTFQDGPVSFYSPNPYFEQFPLESTVHDGSGVGYYIGLTADIPINETFGIVGKLNYHARNGSFDRTTDSIPVVTPQGEVLAAWRDEVDWAFNYVGVDLLLRVQLVEESLYLLLGPSLGFLTGNNANLTQTILTDGVFYQEEAFPQDPLVNQLTEANSDGEVEGFSSTRVDIKFGLGSWFHLSDNLYLVPEAMVAFPLTQFTDVQSYGPNEDLPDAALFDRQIPFIIENEDFNMLTFFFTVGLRWQLDM